jgi:tetratricopeptide (TPR) repeat protein
LLQATGKHEQRAAMWLQEAARTEDASRRARALVRAARVCRDLGRGPEAVRHLRSAWITAPGDGEVLDALCGQLAPVLSEAADANARTLVELYSQAADNEPEPGRKVAFFERVALLWEEVLGDPGRAARAYEEILDLDTERRSALLGLERTAARSGDSRALARALLDEARLSTDAANAQALRMRAASALADRDPSRALELAREILGHDPRHPEARALETRIEEAAGRWDRAARSLRERIDTTTSAPEKVSLWLSLARIQRMHLHEPLEAMASLEQACSLDPAHPVPRDAMSRLLDGHGDVRSLRDAIERIASRAATPEERARHLGRVAEIDELRLGDDAAAIHTLQRALADAPDDDLIADRLARVVARHSKQSGGGELGELATLLAKRIDHASTPDATRTLSFELAALLVELGREPVRATALLETALAQQGDHAPSLRTLESLHRRSGDLAPLARVLDKEGNLLGDARARLGALWNLATLEEWKLPVGDAAATYRRILELDPTDPGALEATVRRELADARAGDPRAQRSVIGALRALVSLASDEDARCAQQLLLATMLEKTAAQTPEARTSDELAREALERYRDALRIDEFSVTASTGVARLAARFRDSEGAFAAARSLAEIAGESRVRARYLVDAAELLLGRDDDERLGPPGERREQAAVLLERALDADPDSIAAAGRLAGVLLDDRRGERVVSAFRSALARASSPDAAVMLASEIARIARDELQDLTVAIEAMRRVRAVAPLHVPSLFMLAELCIAQRTWPEAVEALESVVSIAHDPAQKLTALFALASIYEKVLVRPRDVERVLRAALAIEPHNARALGALLRRLAAEPLDDGPEDALRARRSEIVQLLERFARVEKDAEQRSLILMELAEVRSRLGDAKGAEGALVEAVAVAPSNAHAFTRLAAFFQAPGGRDAVGYARALNAVIAGGQQLGAVDARWFATLGHLETTALSRMRDGIVHLQRAVSLDPTLYETRFELGGAHERMGANQEATRVLVGMLTPAARPILSIARPAAALALLEKTLLAERRGDEALVVSELLALAGELDEGRRARLRGRRLPPLAAQHQPLDRQTLVTHVLPPEGRHILLEVAAAIAGVEAKALRSDLTAVGVSSRDRISSRDRHPTRALLDRLARQLGVGEVELALTPGVTRTRVLSQDVPWIVAPASLPELPEPAQAAALARVLARIAYGVPWLEELPAAHIDALLVAAARQVVAGYGGQGEGGHVSALVAQYDSALARGLARRQRRLLEELSTHLAAPQSRPMAIDSFIGALVRAELRATFVVTGDLLALIDDLCTTDATVRRATGSPGPQALSAVLEHPLAGDLVRFALTAEATALRRRVGATWTP